MTCLHQLLSFPTDKFDQFWVINKKLMEPGESGNFKHIPFRCYQGDLPFSQCLVKPVNSEGNARTLQCLLEDVYSHISIEKCKFLFCFFKITFHYFVFQNLFFELISKVLIFRLFTFEKCRQGFGVSSWFKYLSSAGQKKNLLFCLGFSGSSNSWHRHSYGHTSTVAE